MVQQTADDLLAAAEEHVIQFFEEKISPRFVFHDLDHTQSVVESVLEIGEGYELSDEDLELLQLAAWFHDLGYDQGAEQHEERSMQYARTFLEEHQYAEEVIQKIEGCIKATRVPQSPKNLLEEILCDADLSHLGKSSYWTRTGKIRQELIMTKNIIRSEQEWVEFELNFMLQHRYHTPVASRLYNEGKSKHIRQLYKQKARLNPDSGDLLTIPKKPKKKKKKKDKFINTELSQLRLGRGVETMYRVTYRTHINLSSIADNKANIMLSINAIIISIVVSTLVPSFADNKMLIVPTMILLGVCLVAVIFATLSTRPKVTEGKFTRTDIEEKNTNLLFFGNYYNMDLDDFHWGMMEMIKDTDFLYSSMTRDLYYLGKVLAKKYAYLRICYAVFMYGLIGAVLAFAITFMLT
jgi:predicted metal-dependent HD superfamily phosphohydrolase